MRRRDLKWLQDRLPSEIRALTVDPPYAWAIVEGHKSIENRRKPPVKEFIGEIVAIHAAKSSVRLADLEYVADRVRAILPDVFEAGAIIGFARIVGSVRSDADLDEKQRRWFDGVDYGWVIEDAVRLPVAVPCLGQLGFWRVPWGIMNRLREQIADTSKIRMPVAFSWGYKGWGNAIPEVIGMFDAVERHRGFKFPIFVDVRVRRNVRAEGFSGAKGIFERRLGKDRYRWMSDLGNKAIRTGRGPARLVAKDAVYELLGLIIRAQQERRRVVFFCSCSSPCGFANCHRRIVSRTLIQAARRLNVPLRLEEWPGGEPKRGATVTVRVETNQIEAGSNSDEAKPIDLGKTRPNTKILSLPTGSIVRLKSGRVEAFVSLESVKVRSGHWYLTIFPRPANVDNTQTLLLTEAKRLRKKLRLDQMNSRPMC